MKIRNFSIIVITTLFFALSLNAMTSSQESDKVLQNSPVRLSPNSGNFDVFANLIFWTAKEAGADCWAEVITSDSSTSSNNL